MASSDILSKMADDNHPDLGGPPSPIPPQIAVTSTPTWKITEDLPELTETNFNKWHSTLMDVLQMHDMQHIMTPGFSAPPGQTDFYKKALASCRRVIAKSISTEVETQLPDTVFMQAPSDIVSTLKDLLKNTRLKTMKS